MVLQKPKKEKVFQLNSYSAIALDVNARTTARDKTNTQTQMRRCRLMKSDMMLRRMKENSNSGELDWLAQLLQTDMIATTSRQGQELVARQCARPLRNPRLPRSARSLSPSLYPVIPQNLRSLVNARTSLASPRTVSALF